MMKFANGITRKPCKALVDGLTDNPQLGKVEYEKALEQHAKYVQVLKDTGMKVEELEAIDELPDSCFVEDTFILTSEVAIMMRPATDQRFPETAAILDTIKKYYPEDRIEYIEGPGTVEGGDVIMADNHFFIGVSARSTKEGGEELIAILEKYGHTGELVELKETLHLGSVVNYLENNVMLVGGEFVGTDRFSDYQVIEVPEDEEYAGNSLWLNGIVIVPTGYPKTKKLIEDAGYETVEVDSSEYRKVDGSLTCLSLRFTSLK